MNADVFNLLCPFQLNWLREDAPLAIGEKSRRIGWTWTHALKVVLDRIEGKGNYYHSSADMTASVEFIDYCGQWGAMVNAVAKVTEEREIIDEDEITTLVMKFENGTKIVAGSSNPKFFRSKGGEVGLDEFAFHGAGRELYKAAHATAMFWGHPMRIWSTHNGEGCYFNQVLSQAKSGKLKARVHTVTIEDAVRDGIVERIIMRKKKLDHVPAIDLKARQDWLDELRATCPDEQTWQEEYMCRPSSDSSAYLSYDLIRAAVAENLTLVRSPADLPAGKIYYAGYDVGRRHDLSVLWVIEKVGDVYWTRMLHCLQNQSFTVQAGLLNALMQNNAVRRLCVDETGLGMQLAEQARERWGSRVEGVTLSGPAKASMGAAFKDLFADKLIRIPTYVEWSRDASSTINRVANMLAGPMRREDWLIEDLHKTRKLVTAAGNVRLAAESDSDGHADGFWAGALAVEAAGVSGPRVKALAQMPVGW